MSLNLSDQTFKMIEINKPEVSASGSGFCSAKNDVGDITSILSGRPNFDKRGISMASGFIKISRDGFELIEKDPDAFILLSLIAKRAKRIKNKFDRDGLEIGQAFIGDYQVIGLTEQRYRDAKKRIEQNYKLATFKGTNKGTIATLLNTDVYDINCNSDNEQINEQKEVLETDKKRTENGQTTTNKEYKNIRNKNNTPKPPPSAGAVELFEFFIESLKKHIPQLPESKHPTLETAANFDLLLRENSSEKIRKVIIHAHTGWWARKIHGPRSLKNKFIELSIGMDRDEKKNPWKKNTPHIAPTFEASTPGGPSVEIM